MPVGRGATGGGVDVVETDERGELCQRRRLSERFDTLLDDGVPRRADGALTGPFGVARTALDAREHASRLGHRASMTKGCQGDSRFVIVTEPSRTTMSRNVSRA